MNSGGFKLMKRILLLLLISLLIGCGSSSNYFFTNKDLEKYHLRDIKAPNESKDYYSTIEGDKLSCHMNISNDMKIYEFVGEVLSALENNRLIAAFGYDSTNDSSVNKRFVSKSLEAKQYSLTNLQLKENSVSNNAYVIYYTTNLVDNVFNDVYTISIVSYTNNQQAMLQGYNLCVSITKIEMGIYYYLG